MHKQLSLRVVAAVMIFTISALGIIKVSADNSLPWLSSTLSFSKEADASAPPPTLGNYGNINCAREDAINCSVPTLYGAATEDGAVRFGSTNSFSPVITYVDGRQHFLPIPNSDTTISYFSGPVYGLGLAFNYNFLSSIVKASNNLQIIRAPDAKLTDASRHLLAADFASMNFSNDSRWMVVSDPNVAILRVNLQTFEVLPFAAGFNYTIGLDPAVKTAISNDGRYAVIASKNFSTFRIYDLSTCGAVPSSITGPISCQSRDLSSFMQANLPGYSYAANIGFDNDDTLSFYAVYKDGSVNKTARFVMSNSPIADQIDYLALGDSYISGEGAFDYAGGTDSAANRCHLSYLSYPFLLGHDLNYNSYNSVACSGATTPDITDTGYSYIGQADKNQGATRAVLDETGLTQTYLDGFTPGHLDQLEFVKAYQPKVLTVSIGGNDMGFSNILTKCVEPRLDNTCYNSYEDRLELIRQIEQVVYPRLVQTYSKLKAAGSPDMRVYVIGYPQIAKPGGDCALNVHLDNDELIFAQQLINYLDSVIQQAAVKTGVDYVDTQDALDGHRLCEAGPGSVAMNGLTAGNDRPSQLGGPIGDESYHPNAMGYELLENAILAQTHNLTDPMPAANLSAALPAEKSLEILNLAHSGRAVNTVELDQDISPDLVYQQSTIAVSIKGTAHDLAAGAKLNAELHSTPISLGSFTADSNGNLSTTVTIPPFVPAGYHSLHFYGVDITGQPIDIYKPIYVAARAEDLDGDSMADSAQKCVGIAPSGQDSDQDGIDDACDPDITQPPAPSPQLSPSSNSQIDLTANPQTNSATDETQTADAAASGSNQTADQIQNANFEDQSSQPSTHVLGLTAQKPHQAVVADSNNSTGIITWNRLMLAVPVLMITAGLAFKLKFL